MKVVPIKNEIKIGIKKLIKLSSTDIKPIKNYSQYLKEYGLK